jgi:hypothetical protein
MLAPEVLVVGRAVVQRVHVHRGGAARREAAVRVVIVVQGDADLAKVVLATGSSAPPQAWQWNRESVLEFTQCWYRRNPLAARFRWDSGRFGNRPPTAAGGRSDPGPRAGGTRGRDPAPAPESPQVPGGRPDPGTGNTG